jgi:iron complex transport system permease protein
VKTIRIVLDITRLVEEGKLTAQEAERLQALARRETGSLAINVLMSFGAVAVAAGIIAPEPAFSTGAELGVALVAIGLAISFFAAQQWGLLGTAITIIGALLLAGGIIGLSEADFVGLAFAALLFLALAVAIRSSFLVALVPLTLAGALGSSTGYAHAVYMLTVNEPSITIAFFALLAGAGYLISRHVGQAYQQLAITFARVSLILVNFGFWIGSLWGDYPGETWAQGEDYRLWSHREAWRAAHIHVPEIAFIVGWAILIIAVGVWAARTNRRWVVTTAAVFGAIEFYTQWFERLDTEPWAIIVAGLSIVAFAIALWRYNLTAGRPQLRSPAEPKGRDQHRSPRPPDERQMSCHF